MLSGGFDCTEINIAFFGVFVTRLKSTVVMPSCYYQFKEVKDFFSPLSEKHISDVGAAFSRTSDGRIDFGGTTLSKDYDAIIKSKTHSALGLLGCKSGPVLNRTSSYTSKLPDKPFFSSVEIKSDILKDLKEGVDLEALAKKRLITEKTIGALSLHKDEGALMPAHAPLKDPFRYELGLMLQMQANTMFYNVMREGKIEVVPNSQGLSMLEALQSDGNELSALMGKDGKHIAEKSADFIESFKSATGANPNNYAEFAACAFAIEESKRYNNGGSKLKGAGVYIFDQKDNDEQAFRALYETHIKACVYED